MHARVRDYCAEHLETFVNMLRALHRERPLLPHRQFDGEMVALSDSNAALVAHCFCYLELQVQRRSARPEKTRQSTIID
jgi:hypothetical protein